METDQLQSETVQPIYNNRVPKNGFFMKKLMKSFLKFKIIYIAIIIILVIIGIVRGLPKKSTEVVSKSDPRAEINAAKAIMVLNRDIQFPIKDDKGKEVTKIKYTFETAELHDEIIVQGQRMVAVKGKTFFILTIKINNPYDKAIEINARDYVRLSANNDTKELLAADIHNDPVLVQAISTKNTRLGFPINDSDKNLVLIVGEIKGEKQKIQIGF
jgi:hypothetical protein